VKIHVKKTFNANSSGTYSILITSCIVACANDWTLTTRLPIPNEIVRSWTGYDAVSSTQWSLKDAVSLITTTLRLEFISLTNTSSTFLIASSCWKTQWLIQTHYFETGIKRNKADQSQMFLTGFWRGILFISFWSTVHSNKPLKHYQKIVNTIVCQKRSTGWTWTLTCIACYEECTQIIA